MPQIFLCRFLFLIFLSVHGDEASYQSIDDENASCISGHLISKYNLNQKIYKDCSQNRNASRLRFPRRVDPTFRGKPKAKAELLATKFHMNSYNFDQTNSLVTLVNKIAVEYLSKCAPVIYYDRYVERSEGLILENLFKTFPNTFYHGEINENFRAINSRLRRRIDANCKSYILFLSDPLMTRKIIGPQLDSRVILVARSTQWKLRDFLASEKSSNIVNLLVIGESLTVGPTGERPYVLYTHKLYSDSLGSNVPVVLTSWIRGALSRPHVNLFPPKFEEGFAGHRFLVSAVNQPPYIFTIRSLGMGGTTNVNWDGIEYRLLNIFSKKLNFSVELTIPPKREDTRDTIEAIQFEIARKNTDIGMSGVYITEDRLTETDMSLGHSSDCAAFITLSSKAKWPKYRAIMGPFQWPVWVALTVVYLGAVFPIVFTDRLTLSHLVGNWGEIENMFWYVFGMFTNSLTFSGKYSWSNSKKDSTRMLIGAYWFFTIIITACYTGSIIAFVTLPAFPETVDSVTDLLGLFFRVGTLDKEGWENYFKNSTHEPTAKLYKKMEFVSTLEEGIGNVTQSFFWNYAFLGSRSQLEYVVQSNFTAENLSRRSALHLSEECFALFQVGYLFPRDAVYKHKIDSLILLAQQSGIVNKIENEVRWTMQRSATGKLLQASSGGSLRERIQDERQLTTADTEGMFLLMGIGYALAAIALVSEIVGGITNKCRQILKRSRRFSSSWSSERSSATDGGDKRERSRGEQRAHDKRKANRRRVALETEAEEQGHAGFGARQFNLTKTTLKELYGNYNKQEPSYVIRHGKLLLESEVISDTSISRDSSAELPLPTLRVKTKAIVLTDIGNNDPDDDDEENCDGDVEATLANFDRYLGGHEDGEVPDDVVYGCFTEREEELFGCRVNAAGDVEDSFKNLKLFSPAEDKK